MSADKTLRSKGSGPAEKQRRWKRKFPHEERIQILTLRHGLDWRQRLVRIKAAETVWPLTTRGPLTKPHRPRSLFNRAVIWIFPCHNKTQERAPRPDREFAYHRGRAEKTQTWWTKGSQPLTDVRILQTCTVRNKNCSLQSFFSVSWHEEPLDSFLQLIKRSRPKREQIKSHYLKSQFRRRVEVAWAERLRAASSLHCLTEGVWMEFSDSLSPIKTTNQNRKEDLRQNVGSSVSGRVTREHKHFKLIDRRWCRESIAVTQQLLRAFMTHFVVCAQFQSKSTNPQRKRRKVC